MIQVRLGKEWRRCNLLGLGEESDKQRKGGWESEDRPRNHHLPLVGCACEVFQSKHPFQTLISFSRGHLKPNVMTVMWLHRSIRSNKGGANDTQDIWGPFLHTSAFKKNKKHCEIISVKSCHDLETFRLQLWVKFRRHPYRKVVFTSDTLKHAELSFQKGGRAERRHLRVWPRPRQNSPGSRTWGQPRIEGNKATVCPDQTTNYAQKPSNKLR